MPRNGWPGGLRLPAILFLLLIGLIAGPGTGLILPGAIFGDLLFALISLGVAVILFEGSLTLRLDDIKGRGSGSIVPLLITLGALVTWLGMGTATWWLLDISAEVVFLFGALMTVTGPTVSGPLLRTVRPVPEVARALHWEGILIDPIGALLAVLVFEFIVSGQQGERAAWTLGIALRDGGLAGAAGAFALAELLRRHRVPEYLRNVTALVLGGVHRCEYPGA